MPDIQPLGESPAPQAGLTEQGAAPLEEYLGEDEKAPSDAELGAEAGAETEIKPEEEKKEDEVKPEQKVVPLAALHEERERRKELSKRLEEAELRNAAERAKLEERVNIILGSLQPKPEQPPAADLPPFIRQYMAANPGATEQEVVNVFFQEEPTNYLKWQGEIVAKRQEELAEQARKQDEVAQVQTQFTNFVRAYKAQSEEFAAKTPEFPLAYNFLLKQRDQELQYMGFTDPVQRAKILQNEEIGIVEQAFRNKRNPAEAIFEVAKYRGFKIEEKPAAEVKPANLEAEKKAAEATKSLGAVPGAAAGKMTAEALLQMSEEEFAAATKDGKWAELFK